MQERERAAAPGEIVIACITSLFNVSICCFKSDSHLSCRSRTFGIVGCLYTRIPAKMATGRQGSTYLVVENRQSGVKRKKVHSLYWSGGVSAKRAEANAGG